MSSSSSRQPPLPPPRKAAPPLTAAAASKAPPESGVAAAATAEKTSSPMMARSAPVPVPLGTRRRGALYRSARLLHDSGEHAIVGAPLPPPASPPVMPYNSTSSSLSSATSPHHRRLSPTRSQGAAASSNSTTPPSKSSAETLRETIARFTGASLASTITGSPVVDAVSGKSTPDGMGSVEDVARRSRTSTLSSGCMSCGGGVCGALSTSSSAHTGQLQRANRPSNIILKEQLAAKLVPGVDPEEQPRLCSPPPDRRSSYASTSSDITLPYSASYQNLLLSPLWTSSGSSRRGSFYPYYGYASDDCETPPNEAYLPVRPRSAQSTPAECICVPPVLLSPVLSRPLRSQSAASSPLPTRTLGSDSDGDISVIWRSAASRRSQGIERHGSRTNTPTMSPILNRSTSASKLAASFANRSSSGSSLLSARNLLRRTDSDAAEQQRRQRQRRGKRRPSFLSHGMCSETSVDSCSSSSSNIARLRTSLGHSDPQISASIHSSLSQQQQQSSAASAAGGGVGGGSGSGAPLPAVRLRKDVLSLSSRGARHSAARRSLNASTSPVLAPRCRSPAAGSGRQLLPTAPVGAASTSGAPSGGNRSTATVPLRSYSTRSGSNLMAPPAHDNRRWSLASLPSTSGYGTPGSNSAFSSQYSSSEQLNELLDSLRLGGGGGGPSSARFDSNDSSAEDPFGASGGGPGSSSGVHLPFRPRSRSLTSPIKLGASEWSVDLISRNSVYKERFPRAKHQMEERLATFIAENAPLSGGASCGVTAAPENEEEGGGESSSRASSRRSMVLTAETTIDPSLLRLIADGATRFLHHQLVEIASDCLGRSRDDTITCSYFCEMSQRLDETLAEAQQKTCGESCVFLSILVKQLLMIVSRPARLLECLEFDPDEFYHLLEEAEGVVREQLGSGSARVPDLPQYIIGKLGLDRDPLLEEDGRGVGGHSPPPTPAPPALGASSSSGGHQASGAEAPQKQWPNNRAPCEDDLESIRLVSNGAYGAVYLVRHRETRQRFALKKMNKQTLMLRNQIDQVFAERDILTMTDNPFVVSFYGSFETRHHLCMLMEYVEGGDCAALLKKAGTLPIDLARLYVAETILAIEYLHSYGVVHRDLKPDNLLITAMGHIKLTDFGLSKIGLMNRTTLVCEGFEAEAQQFKDKQLCGTPEYIAPEVILRQGYGKPVDWWALGVITYEFLVGCVPFFGESPEDLFSKVISEEVEYPDGEEALPVSAEHLIRALLEKNPVERLGSLSGASQLMAHDFFAGLDFNTLLRQKAEFVPQLENDEDTSYFDSRSDRYNHEAESCGEDEAALAAAAPMFHSFSTASPRHSIVGLGDGPLLPPERISAVLAAQQQQHEATLPPTASPSPTPSSVLARAHSNRKALASANSSEDHSTTDSLNDAEKFVSPIPSAVLLRRRFSAARASNLSTSSSGTTGTGGCGGRGGSAIGSGAFCGTAPSSTDSSIDASFAFLDRRHTHGEEARRHDSGSTVASSLSRRSPLPRFAISCDPDEDHSSQSSLPTSAKMCQSQQQQQMVHELSPVDEAAVRPRSSLDRVSHGLQLVIPSSGASVSSSSTPSHVGGHAPSLPSPGACSATSSLEGGGGPSHHSSTSFISPHALHHADASGSLVACSQAPPLSPSPACLKAPIVMRKGTFGFGFTIRSVRVYLAEHSDYYTIEHIVAAVDEGGPAFEAGLRADDMITHVNNQPVHNLTHPQLMHLILAYGNEIALKVIPMAATSIREGAPRKSVGKLAKRKPSRPSAARRVQLEKKPRKASSLLRRLSGKRPPAETFVPGSSSQKQTFMPRSVSSQDGAILQQPGTSSGCSGGVCCSQQACTASSHHQGVPSSPTVAAASSASGGKRLSDVGLREEHRSPLVGCSSPSSSFSATTWSAFGPASPAAAASGTSTSNSNSSSRPSTLTGLRPKSLSATLPRLSAVVTASTTASQSCSTVVGGAGQPGAGGGGGPQAPPVTATSPIPVSPLARLPSPTRPLSPHHHQHEQQQQQHVHYHYNTTPPALPHPPEVGQSTQTRNATALRHHADSAPPPQAPPPPPPPPQSLSQAAPAAARNLMNRLLNKDVAPK